MFARLALLFVTVPLIELALLVWVGGRIGFWPTMALVIITGVVGAMLARRAGVHVLRQIRTEMAAGRMPVAPMVDGLMVLVGGVVLLTPGLLTDVLGFALLIPGTRRLFRGAVQRRLRRMVETQQIRVVGFGRGDFGGAGGFGGPGGPDPRGPGGPGDAGGAARQGDDPRGAGRGRDVTDVADAPDGEHRQP
jgi:UPF0716 protein FxsA